MAKSRARSSTMTPLNDQLNATLASKLESIVLARSIFNGNLYSLSNLSATIFVIPYRIQNHFQPRSLLFSIIYNSSENAFFKLNFNIWRPNFNNSSKQISIFQILQIFQYTLHRVLAIFPVKLQQLNSAMVLELLYPNSILVLKNTAYVFPKTLKTILFFKIRMRFYAY